jgi:hypothetical protein
MTTNGERGDVHQAPCDAPGRRRAVQPSLSRLVLGGAAGTVALTLIMFVVDPLLTGRGSDLSRTLGAELGNPHGVGLVVLHFFNGSILFPLGFAFLDEWLPGPWLVKGLIWGTMLWLLAGVLAMPMSGSGFFGYHAGGLRIVAITLAGHLTYGALQGLIAGIPGRQED